MALALILPHILGQATDVAPMGPQPSVRLRGHPSSAEADDRIIFMDGGVFVEEGPPEQFYTSLKDPRSAKFLQRLLAGEEGRGKK